MESRIAKLESDVEYIKRDVSDLKLDTRHIRDSVDAIKDRIASAKIWALLLYMALAASLLGTMAKGFGWL